ncbi:type I protein arginine N-methyltransferase Rmt1 [Paecilomyces lecythidis]
MKVVTANFISCAVKSCKISPSAFPLHFQDAELEQQELDIQPEFIRNILPRIDWDALRVTASELGFPTIPETKPEGDALDEQTLKDLHTLLLETHVVEGKLVCGSCGHEYKIKEGIANFLLPSHLGAIHTPLLPACLPLDFNDLSQLVDRCGVRVPLTN